MVLRKLGLSEERILELIEDDRAIIYHAIGVSISRKVIDKSVQEGSLFLMRLLGKLLHYEDKYIFEDRIYFLEAFAKLINDPDIVKEIKKGYALVWEPSTNPAHEDANTVSSAINNPGGIAFNALPIVTQQINSLQSLVSSPLSLNPNLDLDVEWAQIQQIFNAGIRPSVQRLVEFSAVAASSPAESQRVEDVLGLIADLLRWEEEAQKSTPADPALKGLLSALESGLPEQKF